LGGGGYALGVRNVTMLKHQHCSNPQNIKASLGSTMEAMLIVWQHRPHNFG